MVNGQRDSMAEHYGLGPTELQPILILAHDLTAEIVERCKMFDLNPGSVHMLVTIIVQQMQAANPGLRELVDDWEVAEQMGNIIQLEEVIARLRKARTEEVLARLRKARTEEGAT